VLSRLSAAASAKSATFVNIAESAFGYSGFMVGCWKSLPLLNSYRETPTIPKTRVPNFLTLNPLISSEPPKEMLGKNLEKAWRL
jgi:hypothetical protein